MWGSDLRVAPRMVSAGGPPAAGPSAARPNEATGLARATPPPPTGRAATPPVSRPPPAPAPKLAGGIDKVSSCARANFFEYM